MSDVPLIWTSKGNIPIEGLEYLTEWNDLEDQVQFIETYKLDGEIVKRKVNIQDFIYFAGMGDWYGGMCECDECRKVYEEETWTDADGKKHPGYSATARYETFIQDLLGRFEKQPALWADTAILITTDEGGGFFDSGYIQTLDFFGDGIRIPFLVISPYARKGYVDHVYQDHASILKFIEYNWGLPPLSDRSRDRLPNPVARPEDPYRPINSPAIGDLTSLFDFKAR